MALITRAPNQSPPAAEPSAQTASSTPDMPGEPDASANAGIGDLERAEAEHQRGAAEQHPRHARGAARSRAAPAPAPATGTQARMARGRRDAEGTGDGEHAGHAQRDGRAGEHGEGGDRRRAGDEDELGGRRVERVGGGPHARRRPGTTARARCPRPAGVAAPAAAEAASTAAAGAPPSTTAASSGEQQRVERGLREQHDARAAAVGEPAEDGRHDGRSRCRRVADASPATA